MNWLNKASTSNADEIDVYRICKQTRPRQACSNARSQQSLHCLHTKYASKCEGAVTSEPSLLANKKYGFFEIKILSLSRLLNFICIHTGFVFGLGTYPELSSMQRVIKACIVIMHVALLLANNKFRLRPACTTAQSDQHLCHSLSKR